jgi:serine/threonine-protein kinase
VRDADRVLTTHEIGPGDRILDYRILAPIGRGGFGVVYRAEHELLRRIVAIKVPRDASALPALRRSARIQSSLDDPGIVRTLEASLTHDPPYVVFEHVDGPSLAEVIGRGGPLPWPRALPLLRDVAHALRHAHQRGFVHGDVKPANVLIDSAGVVERSRLTDFGSVENRPESREASQVRSSVALDTATRSEIVGTLPYVAPEVRRGELVDERSDVYAFGVMLFEVLTGHLPEGRELPRDLVPEVPRGLDVVFDRCFARRERRARGFDEILFLLERVSCRTPLTRPRGHSRRPQRRGTASVLSSLAAILRAWSGRSG